MSDVKRWEASGTMHQIVGDNERATTMFLPDDCDYLDTPFVLASDHDAKCAALEALVEELTGELARAREGRWPEVVEALNKLERRAASAEAACSAKDREIGRLATEAFLLRQALTSFADTAEERDRLRAQVKELGEVARPVSPLLARLDVNGGRYLLSVALTREEYEAQEPPTFGGKGHVRWLTDEEYKALIAVRAALAEAEAGET